VQEPDPQLILVDNPVRNRYEARLGNKLAGFVTYLTRPGVVVLVHTEVEPEFEGTGVGGRLASAVLEALRADGQQVDPVCPFIASYIERHPKYADLVARPDP
jgi:predicted GNAT family acetyltransferase